jgi:hypothetical protein
MNLHRISEQTPNDRLVRWLNEHWRNTHAWRTTNNPDMLQYNYLIPGNRLGKSTIIAHRRSGESTVFFFQPPEQQ